MQIIHTIHEVIEPRVIERTCGGWLATAPRGAWLSIGVTGSTEIEARANFSTAVSEWARDLANNEAAN